jgi:pyruvate kinase
VYSDWEYTRRRRAPARAGAEPSVQVATVRAAAYAALESRARVVAVFTESGSTAQLMSGERVPTRVFAFTPFHRTVQRLALTWGVVARRVTRTRTSHEMTLEGERILREERHVRKGDRIVIVTGTSRERGMTNTMNIRVLS